MSSPCRLSLLLLLVVAVVNGVEAHGSHQHMKNRHDHYVPKPGVPVQSVLKEEKMIHDADHLKEDLKDVYTEEQISRMTEQELDFHYFKLHDYDANDRLDGLEILAAINHVVPHDTDLDLANGVDVSSLPPADQRRYHEALVRHESETNHYLSMVDQMFLDSDINKDGFIDYREYVRSRRPIKA